MTVLTQEEITQFCSQLAEYPEALAALDAVQECDGYLEDAIALLLSRETGKEPTRGMSEIWQKCRKVICQEEFRNELAGGLLGLAIEPVAVSVGIPPSVATVLIIYVYKTGIKKFCEAPESSA